MPPDGRGDSVQRAARLALRCRFAGHRSDDFSKPVAGAAEAPPMHSPSAASLPRPDDRAAERSRRLAERIRAEIDSAGGWIGFERYMQPALNEPGLGYYASDDEKFGAAGDFVTAPELSDALARAMAAALAPMLAAVDDPAVLELGAGNGTLAAQLL